MGFLQLETVIRRLDCSKEAIAQAQAKPAHVLLLQQTACIAALAPHRKYAPGLGGCIFEGIY